ncbi:TraM recognition domain-containing protein [Peribacillus sp. R9-11]|uniref:TraM recognition domain-containing protein n=1 Tax=Peribacillus sp. R9-11 TaxID=3073271 RepID=UPI002868478C|nr:TraM recognition domain-containing protein [Peribacillus sp. R9-11]WMX58975.1 type IV secretion system DNA-binding domain-containing protein [Peribacillus sp. R9-11]
MEQQMEKPQGKGTADQEIEQLVLWGVGIIAGAFFIIPMILAMIGVAVLKALKKESISHYIGIAGALILIFQALTGKILSYLAIFKEMNVPYVVPAIEKLSHKPLEMNFSSYLSVLALSMVFIMAFSVLGKYFWKHSVKSKQTEIKKQKEESKYVSFRKNRLKFLDKQQKKYRESDSKDTFIGYSEFKERVELSGNEFNYHMLAVGGTGTGKTTLLASVMEGALKNDKPIIFVDGKGEYAAMQEFKKFCEAYGKKVYMFSEVDSYTYNPIKHGTPTEIRDKIMNLFEWSEPYYKNFSSRYLQLVVKLLDETGTKRELQNVYKLTGLEVFKFFQSFEKTKEIEVEVEVERVEEIPEDQPEENTDSSQEEDQLASLGLIPEPEQEAKQAEITQEDEFASLFGSIPPETEETPEETPKKREKAAVKTKKKKSEKKKTRKVKVMEIQKKTVKYLDDNLQELKDIFVSILADEEAERCLTGLKNQLGELLESDLGHLFVSSNKEIDLRQITDEGNVVIFSISGSRYREYIKKLGKIIILDVNSLVAYRQSNGMKRTLTIYDEFSAYGNSEIVDLVNKSRSAGFECIISTQSLADIDAVEPFLTNRIISNCGILATGRVDAEDAEKLASQFGTFEDQEITSQVEKKHNLRQVYSEMGTVRGVERFIAHPNTIKNLQVGEIFIKRKMKEEKAGTYTRRVYVRNALNLGGIKQSENTRSVQK